MKLTCPDCKTTITVSDDELFPSCECGHVFESMPILDQPSDNPIEDFGIKDATLPDYEPAFKESPETATQKIVPREKKSKPKVSSDVIVSTGELDNRFSIDKYLGLIAVEVIVNEEVILEELARDILPENMERYQKAIESTVERIKKRAIELGANAVINLSLEHRILPVGLGGPGIMVFANGTAVKYR